MSATDVLYIDNTNNVWIDGLSNDINGAFINDAACLIVEVLNSDDMQVSGTANISMTYKAASDGENTGSPAAAAMRDSRTSSMGEFFKR